MTRRLCLSIALSLIGAPHSAAQPPVAVSGELKQWHKVTLTLDGPKSSESDNGPNPFLDYRMTVTFAHESGAPKIAVPGYFAADGDAANTSATAGTKWRAHFAPDKTGRWDWRISFVSGKGAAVDGAESGRPVAPFDGAKGTIRIGRSDKTAPDFRALGRLRYTGRRYLQFAGTGEYFLKAGADSPETLLAYADFDGTSTKKSPLKSYMPHVRDWTPGDPVWKDGKGKGLIGALNYLSSEKVNAISFLTYNAGGDGDNVWPFVDRDDKFHYDCSKLDQWQIVFDHAQRKGIYLHFKLQETENDDNRAGRNASGRVPASLDGGDLGPERKLYLRELIARFGYSLALNWNLGEENTQTPEQQRAMARYIRDTDPYRSHIVVHTYPNEQEKVYTPLLGEQSVLTGASLQNAYDAVHELTVKWIDASAQSGRPWVVANDEQGTAALGAPPDPGYRGFNGKDPQGGAIRTLHDIRKYTLWGNLMAGGAGVEYYFGYQLPENDLLLEDFRSRDKSWDYARIALDFFRSERIPFWEMSNADGLAGNPKHENTRYCFAKEGQIYVIYLPAGGSSDLDLGRAPGPFRLSWFDPRNGGPLQRGGRLRGGGVVTIGPPPGDAGDDWLAVIRRN
jgi:hypothetical protein